MSEFLSEIDNSIVESILLPYREEMDYCSVWGPDEVCLNGHFNLNELRAIVRAMGAIQ
jgi:hypothetical protein